LITGLSALAIASCAASQPESPAREILAAMSPATSGEENEAPLRSAIRSKICWAAEKQPRPP